MEDKYNVSSCYSDAYFEVREVKSSENISKREDERRLKGVVWKSVAGLSGGWGRCKDRGPY